MKKSLFNELAEQGYSHIPVYKEILSDLDTPLTLFMKMANEPYSYLFESVQGGEQWARYSMIGLSSNSRIEIIGNEIQEKTGSTITKQFYSDDPLKYIDEVIAGYNVPKNIEGLPTFQGGLVGYFSYDVVRLIEPVLNIGNKDDELNIPDAILMLSEEVVVMDNLSGKAYLIIMTKANEIAYEQSLVKLESHLDKIKQALTPSILSLSKTEKRQNIKFSTTEEKFLADVDKVKKYIVDGDAFQVVISQRMSVDFDSNSLDLYRALRTLNPSPYMYYLNLGDFDVVGASPEILVRFEQGKAQVRPIAGTRHRGATVEEDLALEKELLEDPKELAEHLMLIDLGRNDIGRISKAGKVKVDETMVIERYSHVMHIVSNVVGEVQDDKTAMDVFKATFPAGTLSGAPKIRAMEIIDELEPVKRNVYGGAIGYISWAGDMDTAITIRTAIIKNNKMYVQAGAGIVYDSNPNDEWEETIKKANSVITAWEMI